MTKVKRKPLPSQETLLEFLDYNPETGVLTWKERDRKWFKTTGSWKCWNKRYAGEIAGDEMKGRRRVVVFGGKFFTSRIAFKMVFNKEPTYIDHENQNPLDNRLVNLRTVTNQENSRNARMRPNNTSGFCGVSWHKQRNAWGAKIKVGGKYFSLGLFTDKADAIAAREAANVKYGFHENHGS